MKDKAKFTILFFLGPTFSGTCCFVAGILWRDRSVVEHLVYWATCVVFGLGFGIISGRLLVRWMKRRGG